MAVEISLTVAEQRKIAEHDAKEPCFRMWLTPREAGIMAGKDWTMYPLDDGRFACWRKKSDLDALLAHGEIAVHAHLAKRVMEDSE